MSHHTGPRCIVVALLLSSRLVACSSDSTPSTAADAGGGGDASADASKSDGGGAGGSGGSTGDAGTPYTEVVCPGGIFSPGLMKNFPRCDDICGPPSHCVTTALAAAQSTATGKLPDCPNDGANRPGKCIPDGISETLGKFIFRECTFFLDKSAGRCVPSCIAFQQSSNAFALQRDVCGAQELCAPCVDPTTGSSTGACDDYCGGTKTDGGATKSDGSTEGGATSHDASAEGGTKSDGGTKTDGG